MVQINIIITGKCQSEKFRSGLKQIQVNTGEHDRWG